MTTSKANVLMVGAGEYTAGYVPTAMGAASDKPAGVVAITLFDLRRLGQVTFRRAPDDALVYADTPAPRLKQRIGYLYLAYSQYSYADIASAIQVDRLVLCDICGTKLPAVRSTMQKKIGDVYRDMDTTVECFPADNVEFDPDAYKKAMDTMQQGDMVIVFTPDDTHAPIAMEAVRRGLHVLLAKPAVKTLADHQALVQAADEKGVLVAVEYHKRFDPMYSDARNRIQALGGFSFFTSTMTQPKQQIDTFKSWAGKSSDISYYLNSHHIDIHNWAVGDWCRPTIVAAMASTGVGEKMLGGVTCEDTISLMTQWQNLSDGTRGTALYTASWAAPKADSHTQQNFHYMGHSGELRIDQAHRGYSMSTDEAGFASLNPLYMRYVPDPNGYFAGQGGYGYMSIARFIQAAAKVNAGASPAEAAKQDGIIASINRTVAVTAILEAGRRSLDSGGAPVRILYGPGNELMPNGLESV